MARSRSWVNGEMMPLDLYNLTFGYGLAITGEALRGHLRLLIYAWSETHGVGRLAKDHDGMLAGMAAISQRKWPRLKSQALTGFVFEDGWWVYPPMLEKAAETERLRARARRQKTISPRLRFAILQRDGFRCRYCGRDSDTVELHVDHVHPVAFGGSDAPDNLLTACVDCNLGKSDQLILTSQPVKAQ